MYQSLRNYRATPHCITSVGPATALFGRPALPYSVAFPCETGLKPALMREHDAHQKLKMNTSAERRRRKRILTYRLAKSNQLTTVSAES